MSDYIPRAYSQDEARYQFLEAVRTRCQYWASPDPSMGSIEDRCFGVAHSIFSIIDGCTLMMPMLDLTIRVDPADQDWHAERGEQWFADGMQILNAEPLGWQLYNSVPPGPPPLSEMIVDFTYDPDPDITMTFG